MDTIQSGESTTVAPQGTQALHYAGAVLLAVRIPLPTADTANARNRHGRRGPERAPHTLSTNVGYQYDDGKPPRPIIQSPLMPPNYQYDDLANTRNLATPFPDARPLHFPSKGTDAERAFYYYGHRYYNPSSGRWLSRDPLLWKSAHFEDSDDDDELPDSRTDGGQMVFVGNDPISKFDAFGRWPSANPFFARIFNTGVGCPLTHENANNRALPGSVSDIAIVDAASVSVDNDQGTSFNSTAKHAMSSPHESKQLAHVLANLWVTRNMILAQTIYCADCGDFSSVSHDAALWYFGLALHTVQDATSPAHHDFQVWRGAFGPIATPDCHKPCQEGGLGPW